jgi:hypothetical protein
VRTLGLASIAAVQQRERPNQSAHVSKPHLSRHVGESYAGPPKSRPDLSASESFKISAQIGFDVTASSSDGRFGAQLARTCTYAGKLLVRTVINTSALPAGAVHAVGREERCEA